jgi:hypothetical protein
VVSTLKFGKYPTLPSSYRFISLLDTLGNLFEKILLISVLWEINERRALSDKQLVFRHRHNTTLQLNRLFERINRKLEKSLPTGGIILDVAKAVRTDWVKCSSAS